MPKYPVRIEFAAMPHSEIAEAAARRRVRGIEASYPSVQEWSVRLEPPQRDAHDNRYGAVVRARVVGGRTLVGSAHGHDTLAALRLAFNALEMQLEEDQASARVRAAAWLAAVRDRMRGWPDFP